MVDDDRYIMPLTFFRPSSGHQGVLGSILEPQSFTADQPVNTCDGGWTTYGDVRLLNNQTSRRSTHLQAVSYWNTLAIGMWRNDIIFLVRARLHQQARWPSGLRRQLKVNPNTLVRKGVGSNPTLVNILLPVV
jgi:hypothetical protein